MMMSERDDPPLEEPIKGKTYMADGWVYRDMPSRLSHEMWAVFLELLGEGNYVILALSRSQVDDWIRGQFLISPQGMQNVRADIARRKKEEDDG